MVITGTTMETTPATITRLEASPAGASRGGSRAGSRVLAVVALGAALPLAYLGVTRFAAALAEARAAGVVATLENGGQPSPQQLRDAIGLLESAQRWRPARDGRLALGLLHQGMAAVPSLTANVREAEQEAASGEFRAGLALAPLDALTWTRLGWMALRRGQPSEALQMLRFSTLIAAYAPDLLWWRLDLWLRLMPYLEDGDASLLRRQLGFAFDADPNRLAGLASRHQVLFHVRRELATAGYRSSRLDAYFPALP